MPCPPCKADNPAERLKEPALADLELPLALRAFWKLSDARFELPRICGCCGVVYCPRRKLGPSSSGAVA